MKEGYCHSNAKWYNMEAAEVLERLESDEQKGLSAGEAASRLEEFGPNELPEKKKQNVVLRFLKHFNDVLIYILFVAAIVTLVLGHYLDTAVILAVAVVNAVIGFFQENKAAAALEGIRSLLSPQATVLRNGERDDIESSALVFGDIVLLEPGDKVPADLRLLETANLKIEESALTGEALPSDKGVATLEGDTQLGDRTNMAYSGTTVSAGTARGIVVGTGLCTEIGQISELMSQVEQNTTPLLRQTAAFGKAVSVAIIAAAVLVYLFGHFFRDYQPGELLLSVIGLAIAAVPEGLPAILSIILSIGVQNMAKRKAIVRNLPSVETLGSVSVICSDKTGTLTKNEMTVKSMFFCDNTFEVEGSGYAPEGKIKLEGQEIDLNLYPALKDMLICFRVCNDAVLTEEEGQWQVQGDPTEGALLTLYKKSPLAGTGAGMAARKSTIPFDSDYKYMAVLVEGDNENIIYIKGAPDKLLELSSNELSCSGKQALGREHWERAITRLAGEGQRMLGAAEKRVGKEITEISHDDIKDVTFLGLAGIMDPPRDEVLESIRICHEAGIKVKMITGDHVETAKAIGEMLGIGNGERALSGREIDEMDDRQLAVAAKKYDVFARTSPEHKLRLVEALQSDGSIVAMTGDGVNDAPALRKADVGVAMGIKGTEVTKEAAEMVLADDNFSTIEAAVEEGRRVYDNLKKTILFILPTNGAESFLIVAAILFGTMIPLTPLQILWVNMVTSVTLSLALAFEKLEPGTMKRPPRDPKARLLSGYFVWRIVYVSILIGGLTLAMNVALLRYGFPPELVRTVTLQTIVFTQFFYLFNSQSILAPAFSNGFNENKAVFVVGAIMLVLQLAITYFPFMNRMFGTLPLAPYFWLIPLVLGLIVFAAVEAEKWVMRKREVERSARDTKGVSESL